MLFILIQESKKSYKLIKNVYSIIIVINKAKLYSIPELYKSVPPGGGNLGSFVRMPEDGTANGLMGFPPGQNPSGFPVPNENFTIGITRNHVAKIKQ